jgi:hypothetical protein
MLHMRKPHTQIMEGIMEKHMTNYCKSGLKEEIILNGRG